MLNLHQHVELRKLVVERERGIQRAFLLKADSGRVSMVQPLVENAIQHGIEPRGVSKRIKDMIDGVYDPDEAREVRKAAEEEAKYDALSEKQLEQKIRKVEKEMLDAARNLEFERAASLRDELKALRDRMMAVAGG